jgi:glycerol-3-phosphate O-acyltransferase/dihydroxyacetone phosphate acyltransferase
MALGAMAKYPGLDVKIVPVGLNYFNGHRFRSRAYVDIGAPMTINPQHLADYKAGGEKKRNACGTLLNEIHTALKSVTVTAPNHDVLHTIWAIRSLYVPSGLYTFSEHSSCALRIISLLTLTWLSRC